MSVWASWVEQRKTLCGYSQLRVPHERRPSLSTDSVSSFVLSGSRFSLLKTDTPLNIQGRRLPRTHAQEKHTDTRPATSTRVFTRSHHDHSGLLLPIKGGFARRTAPLALQPPHRHRCTRTDAHPAKAVETHHYSTWSTVKNANLPAS